jgi:hypothetical protein
MFAAHITSVIVHSGVMTTWPYVLTILVPFTILLTTVAAHPGNMLFNHLSLITKCISSLILSYSFFVYSRWF